MSSRRRADASFDGDSGCTAYLLAGAVSAIILGLLMWAGWIFWRLDTTLERIAFVGLLALVAFVAAYIARPASR